MFLKRTFISRDVIASRVRVDARLQKFEELIAQGLVIDLLKQIMDELKNPH